MYTLVLSLTKQRTAFISGLIFAFSPYMVYHLYVGQTNLLSLQWMAWHIWALLRERRRFLALAAVFLLLNALSDWHYVIYAVVMTAIVALAEALRLRRLRAVVTQIGKLALVGGIFAVIAMPATSAMPVEVPMTLRDGENRIELRSVEPATPAGPSDPRALSIAVFAVALQPRKACVTYRLN